MEPNVLSVLQQLTSNPQLVGQLQNLLTVLSHSDQDVTTSQAMTAKAAATTLGGAPSSALAPASSPVHVGEQQGMIATARRGSTQTVSTTSSVHHGETNSSQLLHRTAETFTGEGVSLQRYEKLLGRCRQLEKGLEQKTREAADATQRVGQLERETTRLMRRVEQLLGAVEGKKQKLDETEAKHRLELAEIENRHELELRAKVASHEEALRRLMEARRLMTTAAQYEQTVRHAAAGQQASAATATTPMSKRGLRSLPGSSVKQPPQLLQGNERGNEHETDADERAAFLPHGSMPVKRERDQPNSFSPAIPRKKRTPRTPSLTAADRVATATATSTASATSYPKTTSQSVKVEYDSPQVRPGAVASAFAEDRYLTKARHPSSSTVSPGPATSTITEAMARHHHHHQQQQQQQQQQQRDAMHNVESRFITQYGTALLPPAPSLPSPPPPPVSNSATTSLAALSRTPRQRELPNGQLQQQRLRSGQRSGTSSAVGGPTRSPSPVNPKRGAEQPRCFVITSLTEEERARVKAAVAAVGQNGVVVESDYEDPPPFTATHIVVRGPPRSMKALCGVVGSKWLVQPEYIYASRDAGFWLDEYEEGGLRCFPPPLKCQRFLLTMPEGIVKEKLEQVIEYGGGEVVRPARDGRSYDQGVVVIASGDDLLRFATRID
ncbi:putative leucine-rich repeat protein [Trypanosoma rangeli]|uniref:Putative leucine-rich repeat protein n=1 Tax=Trypanosoma rangeli TaxID=5698 RepID=A0A422NRT3_TRYRA|nr:putative leucine-rich repeat protein [Trypanosoma rangeli]RNF08178.1 putative leucine-rich repeat protein [Trypanosoma rangeli]|eukprot:RNF08178.1 putative leucine-rich repeat protein [Trypanosoma rangeli]